MSNAAERLLSEVLDYLEDHGMEDTPAADWIRAYFCKHDDTRAAGADHARGVLEDR